MRKCVKPAQRPLGNGAASWRHSWDCLRGVMGGRGVCLYMKNGMTACADILFSFVKNQQKADAREEQQRLLRFYSIRQRGLNKIQRR